jgi:predicted MFS family arabinose efflux permease
MSNAVDNNGVKVFSHQTQSMIILAVGMFALGLDAYVIAGLLPGISTSFGVTLSQAGQAITVFTLAYAIAAPALAAALSGKSARNVLMVGLAIFSLANAASAMAGSLPALLMARVIAGFGAGLFSPVAVAAAVALASPERKGRALGMTLGGMSMGTVIGVPVGLMISRHIGWQSTLWLVTAIGVAALFGVGFCLDTVPVKSPPSFKQRVALLTNGRIAATVGVSFLTAVASLGLYSYVTAFLHASSRTLDVTPYLWIWGIGGLVGSFAIGRLIDKTRIPARLLTCILCCLAVSLLAIPGMTHHGLGVFVPFCIWGAMGWSSLAPQQHALFAIEPEHGAAAVALNSSGNYLGSAVGTLLGGVLLTAGFDASMLPYFAGATAIAAMLLHLLIQATPRRA